MLNLFCFPALVCLCSMVLRGISRALALQQGYKLAQIAEEIHTPDRAAQGTGEVGNIARAIIGTWV